MKGKFIVIDGLDGAGGATQTKLLREYFKKNNIPFEFITSPNYETPVGLVYRKYLDGELELEKEAVFLLVACDVIMNKPIIEKTIKEGKTVLADRYITSTIAYQSANGNPFENLLKVVELMDYPKIDLVIFIDIKPETSMKRKFGEQGKLDKHEKNLEFLEKVRKFYLKEAKMNVLGKWVVIDGEKDIEKIHKDILKIINSLK